MVYLANAINETDGSAHRMLSYLEIKIPIVLVTRPSKFIFNEQLRNLTDYVLFDFSELGWDCDYQESHIFGKNTNTLFADKFQGEEWKKFDEFISEKPPKLMFVRELLKKDLIDGLYPIEYPCWYQPTQIQSQEQYLNRKISAFYNWGYSHEGRRILHGNIWINAPKYGYVVCDNLHNLNSFLSEEQNENKWVSVNIPHYGRFPMDVILGVNGESKVSISMYGAGRKCFRNCEAAINSLMALPNDDLAWSFDWRNEVNCIKFDIGDEIRQIAYWLENEPNKMYDMYCEGVENVHNYYLPNFINHISKLINA